MGLDGHGGCGCGLLLPRGHLSLVTCHWSLVTCHWSLITDHRSLTTDSPITDHRSLITDHQPRPTPGPSGAAVCSHGWSDAALGVAELVEEGHSCSVLAPTGRRRFVDGKKHTRQAPRDAGPARPRQQNPTAAVDNDVSKPPVHPVHWLAGIVCLLGLLHTPCPAQTKRPVAPELPAEARDPDRVIRLGPQTQIHSFALSLDGKTAYVHAGRKYPGIEKLRDELLAVDLKAGKVEREIASPAGLGKEPWSERMLLSTDGRTILVFHDNTSDKNPPMRQIDLATGKVVREISVERSVGRCHGWQPTFSSDSRSIYFSTGSRTQHLVSWNLDENRETSRLRLPDKVMDESEYVVGLWPQGQFVTVIESSWAKDSGVQASRWNPATNARDNSFRTSPVHVMYCGIEPAPVHATGNRLFAIALDFDLDHPCIGVWDLISQRQERTITPLKDFRCRRVCATSDNRLVLVDDLNGTIAVYDTIAGRWVARLSLLSPWSCACDPALALSSDSRTLLTVDALRDKQDRDKDEDFLAVFDLSRYYTEPATRPAAPKP
ncbi:MAG: hypothetical protein ACHRHE_19535 [Tepidisphaerales bacterium]